ncbi:hypothetical protein D3C72_2037980 [compost metagenome]
MLASAEPSARFRLVWMRSARAARSAARPSGSSTMAAITIPTTAAGAPAFSTAASIEGDSSLASATTSTRQTTSSTPLVSAMRAGGGGAWTFSSELPSARKKSRWRMVCTNTNEP